ncbi:hypothetical protein PPMP20_04250 [Paraburkholderia phymatum]|uniref:Uncharacterized protein n=1 Tax=Paraburkholderia phymatum (strain DSM 17167 / CIP 108236 / LMG 21445 / STM815) TaxID=391038 RepID=B2JD41_PARP8|nr:hypothetical protein [Paraburkholderia phymatum]ACC71097.1 hypothetical protein Bphy_1918 [Paraburkholderia phymatum STM815]
MTEYPMLDDKLATLRNAIEDGVKADSAQCLSLMELVDAIGEQFKRELAEFEMSPEFTDSARAALVWVLYHHQGGSSPVGQPIRFALGMGAHDPLKPAQIGEALKLAEKCHFPAARDIPAAPSAPAVDGASAADFDSAQAVWNDWLKLRGTDVDFKSHNAATELVRYAMNRTALSAEAAAGEPVAYVPIHPKNGPLWANTVPTLDSDRPKHYETRALYFTAPPAAKKGE